MNCWEFRHCPEATFKDCPAWPGRGLDCRKVTGTKCDSGRIEKTSLHEKIEFCRTCDYYKQHAHKY